MGTQNDEKINNKNSSLQRESQRLSKKGSRSLKDGERENIITSLIPVSDYIPEDLTPSPTNLEDVKTPLLPVKPKSKESNLLRPSLVVLSGLAQWLSLYSWFLKVNVDQGLRGAFYYFVASKNLEFEIVSNIVSSSMALANAIGDATTYHALEAVYELMGYKRYVGNSDEEDSNDKEDEKRQEDLENPVSTPVLTVEEAKKVKEEKEIANAQAILRKIICGLTVLAFAGFSLVEPWSINNVTGSSSMTLTVLGGGPLFVTCFANYIFFNLDQIPEHTDPLVRWWITEVVLNPRKIDWTKQRKCPTPTDAMKSFEAWLLAAEGWGNRGILLGSTVLSLALQLNLLAADTPSWVKKIVLDTVLGSTLLGIITAMFMRTNRMVNQSSPTAKEKEEYKNYLEPTQGPFENALGEGIKNAKIKKSEFLFNAVLSVLKGGALGVLCHSVMPYGKWGNFSGLEKILMSSVPAVFESARLFYTNYRNDLELHAREEIKKNVANAKKKIEIKEEKQSAIPENITALNKKERKALKLALIEQITERLKEGVKVKEIDEKGEVKIKTITRSEKELCDAIKVPNYIIRVAQFIAFLWLNEVLLDTFSTYIPGLDSALPSGYARLAFAFRLGVDVAINDRDYYADIWRKVIGDLAAKKYAQGVWHPERQGITGAARNMWSLFYEWAWVDRTPRELKAVKDDLDRRDEIQREATNASSSNAVPQPNPSVSPQTLEEKEEAVLSEEAPRRSSLCGSCIIL